MKKDNKTMFPPSKQIIQSVSSFGVNKEDILGGKSKNDFRDKMIISCKEMFKNLYSKVEELSKILYRTIQNSK